MKIGILAVQGDFQAHASVLERLGVSFTFVTKAKHLQGIAGLILPGGESTTMLKFLQDDGLLAAINDFARQKHGILGTCAGAILLANQVINPTQLSLNLLDITLARNAYGRQLASHIVQGQLDSDQSTLEMVFIRAPRIIRIGPRVNIFSSYQGEPVGVCEGRVMLTTFHPELTHDNRVHQLFLDRCSPLFSYEGSAT